MFGDICSFVTFCSLNVLNLLGRLDSGVHHWAREAERAGPITEEEEEVWRRGLELRDGCQKEFSFLRRMMKREPDNLFWRENALIEQKLFDRIDNVLPKRYKKELKARILVPPSEQAKNDVAFSKRTR
jgi:hypothetical protein